MNTSNYKIYFATLLPVAQKEMLLQQLNALTHNNNSSNTSTDLSNFEINERLKILRNEWQRLSNIKADDDTHQSEDDIEHPLTDWLIQLFNTLFANKNVILARSKSEPEYFPAQNNQPARIEFAHGFFQSALHELSHFCVAGPQRRLLPDFGYWYAADGRSAAQQLSFERVEIKPQALECLFTLACGRSFQVSQDNLFADFDTSDSTFTEDVYKQAKSYLAKPDSLPPDAKTLLHTLLKVCKTS